MRSERTLCIKMFKRTKSINKGVFIDNSVKSPTKEIKSSNYIGKINNGYFLPVITSMIMSATRASESYSSISDNNNYKVIVTRKTSF